MESSKDIDQRAAFEAWFGRPLMNPDHPNHYNGRDARSAWEAWQAATSRATADVERDAILEEAAKAVQSMGSYNPIMSYGRLCADAIRAMKPAK